MNPPNSTIQTALCPRCRKPTSVNQLTDWGGICSSCYSMSLIRSRHGFGTGASQTGQKRFWYDEDGKRVVDGQEEEAQS